MSEMIEKVAIAIRDSFNSNDIDCYPLAKAAIEAMREPTKAMLNVDDDIFVWEAMIDAALKD
jgi:hypothetical protein